MRILITQRGADLNTQSWISLRGLTRGQQQVCTKIYTKRECKKKGVQKEGMHRLGFKIFGA